VQRAGLELDRPEAVAVDEGAGLGDDPRGVQCLAPLVGLRVQVACPLEEQVGAVLDALAQGSAEQFAHRFAQHAALGVERGDLDRCEADESVLCAELRPDLSQYRVDGGLDA
jgi:hypothetical protein